MILSDLTSSGVTKTIFARTRGHQHRLHRSKVGVLQVPAARASIVAVYVVVIVFGILGNGLVVAVAASRVARPSPASRNSLQVGSSRDDIVTNCPSQSAGNIREQ